MRPVPRDPLDRLHAAGATPPTAPRAGRPDPAAGPAPAPPSGAQGGPPPSPPPAPITGRRWWRRPLIEIAGVLIGANALAGVATFIFLQYLIPGRSGPHTLRSASHLTAIAFVAYLCFAIPAGAATNARVFRPVAAWLRTNRSPTADEQWATLLQPIRQAAGAFAFWVLAAVLFGALTATEGYPANRVVVSVISILLGALASCSLSALLIERVLRPIFVTALGGDLPGRPYGVGVRPRLLLAWGFGSGVPIVGLMLTAIDHRAGDVPDLSVPVLFLCVAALASGFSLIFAAARSVAEPLEAVRGALARVESGDLSVELDVDDGGEVGRLEAGVNRMVVGLRQRRDLEELFGRHVGEAVAHQALERGGDLGGERRDASMLFVDLVGSTRMAATLPPEEVVRTLNRYFEAVVAAIAAEGGWVNKFEGDGAMCVFGPPDGGDDHAERALRAARRLRAELGGAGPPDVRWGRLDAAIGVSSGEVVAGNIGSPDRFEYTIIGDPVNEAARLTDLAKGRSGRLLASAAAVLAAGPAEAVAWRPAGTVTLRGRTTETAIWEPAD